MASVKVYVTGPTQGTAVEPHSLKFQADTAANALLQAARETNLRLIDTDSGTPAAGVSVFINGGDVRLTGDFNAPLQDGDTLHIVCTATDI